MQYKFRIINGVTIQILRDKLPCDFDSQVGSIIYYNNKVCYINELDYVSSCMTIEQLEDKLKSMSEKRWRSLEYKKMYIKYFEMVLREMKAIKREFTIDEVLRPEGYENWVIMAC